MHFISKLMNHTCTLQFRVTANFRLEIMVEEYSNSNNDCGADKCDLYINKLCLDPGAPNECNEDSCSLDADTHDYNLKSGLPRLISLTAESQPWPVSEVTLQ